MTTQRVFPSATGPATSAVDVALAVGVEFKTNVTAWVTHIHYYRGTGTQEAPVSAQVWRVDSATAGTNMGSVTVPSPGSTTGWLTVALGTPVQLVANQAYRASALYTNATNQGKYTATSSYFTTGGGGASDIVNGFLTAPNGANAVGANQGSYVYTSTASMPINSFNSGNYWVDVNVTDVDPAGGAAAYPIRSDRPVKRARFR